jgi:hypothetical protein
MRVVTATSKAGKPPRSQSWWFTLVIGIAGAGTVHAQAPTSATTYAVTQLPSSASKEAINARGQVAFTLESRAR